MPFRARGKRLTCVWNSRWIEQSLARCCRASPAERPIHLCFSSSSYLKLERLTSFWLEKGSAPRFGREVSPRHHTSSNRSDARRHRSEKRFCRSRSGLCRNEFLRSDDWRRHIYIARRNETVPSDPGPRRGRSGRFHQDRNELFRVTCHPCPWWWRQFCDWPDCFHKPCASHRR